MIYGVFIVVSVGYGVAQSLSWQAQLGTFLAQVALPTAW
jgi:hypothetical protein